MKKRVAGAEALQTAVKIVCNVCGCEITNDSYGRLDNYVSVRKKWEYGTKYDGERHSFEVCADCYEKLLDALAIPVRRKV